MLHFRIKQGQIQFATELVSCVTAKVSTFVMSYYWLLHWGKKKERIGRNPFTCTLDVNTVKFSRKCPLIGHKLVFMHVHDF